MRPVVLDRDKLEVVIGGKFPGKARREEAGVEVVCNHVELRPEDPLEV